CGADRPDGGVRWFAIGAPCSSATAVGLRCCVAQDAQALPAMALCGEGGGAAAGSGAGADAWCGCDGGFPWGNGRRVRGDGGDGAGTSIWLSAFFSVFAAAGNGGMGVAWGAAGCN